MTRRHRIRTLTVLGLSAPLLVGLTIGGTTMAIADSAPAGTSGEARSAPQYGEPTDLFSTGPLDFADPTDTAVGADTVAEELYSYAADPGKSDAADCASGLDMSQPADVTTCTVIGWSGKKETFSAYISPSATSDVDYTLYFAQDEPLSDAAANALNNGLNGTGAYPAFGEQDEEQVVLDGTEAAGRANFVLDGIGREDMTVYDVDGEVDLSVPEPVHGTAVERLSGRTVPVTLLPIPTTGEAPGLLVSIDGP